MCGIAGIISLSGSRVERGKERVQEMLSLMSHRGPDGNGIYEDEDQKVILGNNRLAITDPNYQFSGPFSINNHDFVMSFNGEIYDYIEQSRKIKESGVFLRSKTDTEVLMQGIRTKGLDFLRQVDGCWAFAFYDSKKKELILSRDLLGEKQIFFYKDEKEFIFSSEVFSLLAAINNRLDIDILEVITAVRFFAASSEKTIINQIKKFKPGQALIFDLTKSNDIRECYPIKLFPNKWQEYFNSQPSDADVIEKISELLFISVRNRLARDVPFFTTLSGGIDSNLMAYFATQEKKNIDTIFIETDKDLLIESSDELSEKNASRHTAKILKSNHYEIGVKPAEAIKNLKKNAISSTDGLLDWGTVSFELIGNAVNEQKHKAILVSEGADELCGYKADEKNYFITNFIKKNPTYSQVLNFFNKKLLLRKIIRRTGKFSDKIFEPYCSIIPFVFKPHHEALGHDYLSKFFDRNIVNQTNKSYGLINDIYDNITDLDFSQKIALSYMNYSLPDFSNLRIDKGFMAASVEPRCPYLNLNLVNFLLSMPASYKFRNGYSKFILRKMVEKYIGPEIAWRRKYGFSYPIWSLAEIKEGLNVKENILSSRSMDVLPWTKGGKAYFEKNIFSKLAWPLYALSAIENKYAFSYKDFC